MIFVIIDQLIKMAHFFHCKKTINREETTRLFVDNVSWYRGLPNDTTSDHGPQFVSKFWRSLFEILKEDIKLSSVFHPQTDDQMERVNQVLEKYLGCTINHQQDDWTSYLPLAEFVHNNLIHASMEQTPFYANYGHHSKFDLLDPSKTDNLVAKAFATRLLQLQDAIKLIL